MAQFTTSTTAPATDNANDVFEQLRQRAQQRIEQFRSAGLDPHATYVFERDLKALFDDTARQLLQDEFQQAEPGNKPDAAPRVRHHKHTYRINKRTKAVVDTLFGPIVLWSFLYLCEADGEPGIHPLHLRLGIDAHVTAALAERVGRWAVDHTQAEVQRLLASEHGVSWSCARLRRVLRVFRQAVAGFRQDLQAQRLLGWLDQAHRSSGPYPPVLAVGRDGVMVPIRDVGNQEAGVGTVAVYDRQRQRRGTVYLGYMPQPLQVTLTEQLTALLTAVLTHRTKPLPRLVYVTDKGQAQDSYWQTLKRMADPHHPERRLEWEWVLDFFHACEYVGRLREALFGATSSQGYQWARRMRRWLRDRRQGVSQVLRSATQYLNRRDMTPAAAKAFWAAYRYLRRHRRLMAYERYRREGLPIGSGVTEAACKTVFTQRLKRSGMSWRKASGQVIVDLRVLVLSGIWEDVIRRSLQRRSLVERLEKRSHGPQQAKTTRKAG